MILVGKQFKAVFEVSQVVQTEVNSVLDLGVTQKGLLVEIVQSFKLLFGEERCRPVDDLDLARLGVLLCIFTAGFTHNQTVLYDNVLVTK